ncbi:hypothetical protein QEV83_15685 [Methylocapsa sp. D3K7]|uniref:hypothetical protein n=1 Tax=Methylocapsa sp. D3K7 TaxID=3041435 RepID=UPI00244E853B|nr:hypothetical protein [Methylocapsa sp. D3K7]WGJ14079.1 hypothetical protein QEV83_15685 [Methylocapsa sp. D3K7]
MTEQDSQASDSRVASDDSDVAGAPANIQSFDKPEAAALCFRTHQDALDFARHGVEDSRRRIAALSLNSLDAYIEGESAIYVGIKIRGNDRQYQFLFVRVPARSGEPGADDEIVRETGRKFGLSLGNVKRNQGAMFLGVTQLVQGPKGVISSFVWLEVDKQRHDFRGDILGDVPSFEIVIEPGKVVCKRESGPFGSGLSAGESGSVTRLIQHRSQIDGNVEQDGWQSIWGLYRELNFVDILSRLRLFIDNVGPWLAIEKISNDCFEFGDVLMCASECRARAIENICHGRKT